MNITNFERSKCRVAVLRVAVEVEAIGAEPGVVPAGSLVLVEHSCPDVAKCLIQVDGAVWLRFGVDPGSIEYLPESIQRLPDGVIPYCWSGFLGAKILWLLIRGAGSISLLAWRYWIWLPWSVVVARALAYLLDDFTVLWYAEYLEAQWDQVGEEWRGLFGGRNAKP